MPLAHTLHAHALPVGLLDDLLDAFVQDVCHTRDAVGYADRTALLDYCRRSANPVGRLLLHLYGRDDAVSLARSDAICTALQLINFWQDLGQDIPRGRFYLPEADCARYGITRADLLRQQPSPAIAALLDDCLDWAQSLMAEGAPLVRDLPGRIGWELRLVVQGGLCVLEKVRAQRGGSIAMRRTVRGTDMPRMLWRAWRMG